MRSPRLDLRNADIDRINIDEVAMGQDVGIGPVPSSMQTEDPNRLTSHYFSPKRSKKGRKQANRYQTKASVQGEASVDSSALDRESVMESKKNSLVSLSSTLTVKYPSYTNYTQPSATFQKRKLSRSPP